ncbi:MAG: hypothetical protein LUG93_13580, partial [Lachnospiraceae bacterium]|nr:hypothetical protein [Lachnospiraceae bacterium]
PDVITLREQFYKEPEERRTAIDVTIKMLYGTGHLEKMDGGEDIVGQYIFLHLRNSTRKAWRTCQRKSTLPCGSFMKKCCMIR